MKALDLLCEEFAEVLAETRCTSVVDSDGDRTFVNQGQTRAATFKSGDGFVAAICYTVKRGWRRTTFLTRGFVMRPEALRAWMNEEPIDLIPPGRSQLETLDILLEEGRKVLLDYIGGAIPETDQASSGSQVLAYSDDPQVGIFCTLQLLSGERIFISIAEDSILVLYLDLETNMPSDAIWSSDIEAALQLLGCSQPSRPELLARMKTTLETCASSASVYGRLERL